MKYRFRSGFALCAATLLGCAGREPHPKLSAVEPAAAYAIRDLRLMLTGEELIPSFRLDPTQNQRVAVMDGFSGRVGKEPNWAPLANFGWISPTQISASLKAESFDDWPADRYSIEITDPRGQKAVLEEGFGILGPDEMPPTLTIECPDGPFWPGATIHAKVTASDEPPGRMKSLTWKYFRRTDDSQEPTSDPVGGSCPPQPDSARIACAIDIPIPATASSREKVCLEIGTEDDASNATLANPTCFDITKPTLTLITPPAGGTEGGTNVVLSGTGFPQDGQVFFGNDLIGPKGGVWVSDTTITGYAPAHTNSNAPDPVIPNSQCPCAGLCGLNYAATNKVHITLKSQRGEFTFDDLSAVVFEYHSPPKLLCITPAADPQSKEERIFIVDNTAITAIFRGRTTLDEALPLAKLRWGSISDRLSWVEVAAPASRFGSKLWALDPYNGSSYLADSLARDVPMDVP